MPKLLRPHFTGHPHPPGRPDWPQLCPMADLAGQFHLSNLHDFRITCRLSSLVRVAGIYLFIPPTIISNTIIWRITNGHERLQSSFMLSICCCSSAASVGGECSFTSGQSCVLRFWGESSSFLARVNSRFLPWPPHPLLARFVIVSTGGPPRRHPSHRRVPSQSLTTGNGNGIGGYSAAPPQFQLLEAVLVIP